MIALTRPFPLRQSTDLENYTESYSLPIVYGRARIKAKPYDSTGRLWLLSDGVIQGVDEVQIGGSVINDWQLQKGIDSTGRAVSVLETTTDGVPIVTLRGKEKDGVLLERPDQILADVFSLIGRSIDLDELRGHSQTSGVICAGVIERPASIQLTIDMICRSMGLAWDIESIVAFPPLAATQTDVIDITSDKFSAQSKSADVVTRLTVNYQYDYAAQRPGRSIVMDAVDTVYGIREKIIDLDWVSDNKSAEAYAQKYLQWYAEPTWTIQSSKTDAETAEHISITHPYSPISQGIVTKRNSAGITLVGSSGYTGAVEIIRRSKGEDVASETSSELLTTPDGFIYTVIDSNDRLLAGAAVTLDNSVTRTTDSGGKVEFVTTKGEHILIIKAAGYQDQQVNIVV